MGDVNRDNDSGVRSSTNPVPTQRRYLQAIGDRRFASHGGGAAWRFGEWNLYTWVQSPNGNAQLGTGGLSADRLCAHTMTMRPSPLRLASARRLSANWVKRCAESASIGNAATAAVKEWIRPGAASLAAN